MGCWPHGVRAVSERITTANDKYAFDLGYDYGHSSDAAQAALLKGLFQGLTSACGGTSSRSTQLSYVLHVLDRSTLAALVDLGESAKYHLEEGVHA